MSENKRDRGRFTERPEGAAPLFNPESGRQAALKRWEDKEARNRDALVRFVSEELGKEVTYNQAFAYVVLDPQFREALKGKAASAKLVAEWTGERPEGADAKVLIDSRQVNLYSFPLTPPEARKYIEDQLAQGNNYLASLVDGQMNWDAEDDEIIIIKVPLDDTD
jgi:hypothetical protein